MTKRKTKRYDEGGMSESDVNERMGDSYSSEAKDSDSSDSDSSSAPAATPTPKSNIVTKEQLAASGYDNLRDYMNAKQGLKRRDGSAPSTAKSTPTTVTKEKTTVSTLPRGQAKASDSLKGMFTYDPTRTLQYKVADEATRKSMRDSAGVKDDSKPAMRNPRTGRPMAKGGMASASKRADGKITKGHTNCKMR